MQLYLENFASLRKELKYIFYISIAFIILAEFFIFRNPLFKSGAEIIVKLSYSYISAFIFYFLVVHFKRQNEKRKFYPVLNIRLKSICHHESIIVNVLSDLNRNENFNKLDSIKLRELLGLINPYSPFVGMTYAGIGELSWMRHLLNVTNKTRNEINTVLTSSSFLDVDLVKELTSLYDNFLFESITLFSQVEIGNKNLEDFDTAFISYFNSIEKLQRYRNTEISKYLESEIV